MNLCHEKTGREDASQHATTKKCLSGTPRAGKTAGQQREDPRRLECHFALFRNRPLDRLLAEVGALFLLVGVLHFLFEMRIRKEMLKEVADSVLGNTHLHDSGLTDWKSDSKAVNESDHWKHSPILRIGVQYSPKFADDFYDVLKLRCEASLETTFLVLAPDGKGQST